jgi:hypothetical protein
MGARIQQVFRKKNRIDSEVKLLAALPSGPVFLLTAIIGCVFEILWCTGIC